jgi:hypothetical protein
VEQDDTGGEKEAPAEEAANEQHGGKHHKMSPVVNAAIDAALVLHNKGLERAEQKDADIITEEVKDSEHKQICVSNDLKQIKNSPETIEDQPDQQNLPGLQVHPLYKLQKLILLISLYRMILLFC